MEAIELYKEETMKAAELKASGRKQVFFIVIIIYSNCWQRS